MKIVVLNGSPRRHGNTDIMTEAFQKSAEQKQHTVEILHIADKKITGCRDCKYCYAHDGACAIQDDMQQVRAALEDADMVVFASPIYWFDISAQLKTVIDRLYACGSIGFHFHKTALLLNAAADHVFDAAIAQYKAMTAYLKWEDMGIITIPHMEEKGSMQHAPLLKQVQALGASL